jgi:uncharacterized protein
MMNSRPNALPANANNRRPSHGLKTPDLPLPRWAVWLLLPAIVCGRIIPAYAAPISLSTIDTAYTQNFDTLSNTAGSTTNNLNITGWNMTESGGGARDNEQYAVDSGGSGTGDTYSYGAAGSLERAFGMLRSGTLLPIVGASFTNETGETINSLDIAYTGVEWRLGTAARADQISFEYSLNASDLVTGTWTGVSSLNFVTPDTVTIGAKNGNAASSRTQLSSAISGLNIPNGATFWFRWTDVDASGADDGLAIDDFSLTPHSTLNPVPILMIDDVSLNEGNSGTTIFKFTVSLSSPAGEGGVTFDIATADNSATAPGDYTANSLTGQTIAAGSSTGTFTVLVNGDTPPETNETFFANVTNVTGAIVGDGQGHGMILNDDIVFIHDVQGSGAATPLAGATVIVEGVVTASFQGTNQLQGFFLQEEDAAADAEPATSEGIFVFCNACATPVAEGQRVRASGTVSEFSGMTEITASSAGSVVVTDAGSHLAEVTPSPISLPITGEIDAFYEAREGMLVTFMDTLTVADTYQFSRYGQIGLSQGGRPLQFTEETPPDVAGYALHLDALARRRVLLDDDNNAQQAYLSMPDGSQKLFHPQANGGFSVGAQGTDFFRGGDIVSGLTGVLHWSFAGSTGTDAWRVRPTAASPMIFTVANPRPATPPTVGGAIRAAAVSLLNYFTTIDTTSSSSTGPCGPSGVQECRGADSVAELNRQRERASLVVCTLDAHIVVFTELENTTPSDTISDLLGAINARCGGERPYAFVNTGGTLGSDAIRVGLIYRTGLVSAVGPPLDDLDPIHDRPPQAQTFDVVDAANPAFGERLTVIVNHFRSKGCAGASGPDADAGDGQGCYADRRTQQATRLLTWITGTVAPAAGDQDLLLLGDFNAYARETPVTTITSGGYTDLESFFSGVGGYSYVIGGELGHLDHAFASASLVSRVAGSATWHINADEPDLFDYNDEVKDTSEALYEEKPDGSALVPPRVVYQPGTPYRASDHDPILVGLFQVADLAVTKTDSPDPVIADVNLTYTITVANNGPDAAATVSLSDTLPAGTTFVSLASPAGWSCVTPEVDANGTISCSTASFPLGSAVFTLVAKVSPSVGAGTVLANTATVSSSNPDPNPENNSATSTTTVNPALSIDFSGSGSGTVRSISPDSAINCIKGSPTGCSADYPLGTSVTLAATPSALSLFGGWSSGVTSGANPVTFTMDDVKTVTAIFNEAPLLHIGVGGYPSLQAAYDAATSGAIIQMLDGTVAGTLTADRDVAVTLMGGYDMEYASGNGSTVVTAPLTVGLGRITADRIVVK